MADNNASLFRNGFFDLLRRLGKSVYVESSVINCPNCLRDKVSGKSLNKYNTANPYGTDTAYNKPFTDNSLCSVCGGTAKLSQWTKVNAIVNWLTQNPALVMNVEVASRRCELKMPKTFFEMVNKTKSIRVPTINGNYVLCSMVTNPTGFGIGYHDFFVVYVEALT